MKSFWRCWGTQLLAPLKFYCPGPANFEFFLCAPLRVDDPYPSCDFKGPDLYDRDLYKARHLIKNFFARLKQYRAIATRYDKTARNFIGASIWPLPLCGWLDGYFSSHMIGFDG